MSISDAADASAAPAGVATKGRILVVDDDEDIRLIAATLLRSAGHEVAGARNGREGIDLALASRFDLIFLDVMMPELSGWEVCSTLKSLPETARTPIVMFTVKSEIKDHITGMQVGADEYITKPFTKRRLLEAVDRLLSGRPAPQAELLPRDTSSARSRNLLFDGVTGLPTIPIIIDALRERLLVDQEIGVLFIDIEKYSHIEDFYGWEVFDEVLQETSRALKRLLGTLFMAEDLLAISRTSGSEYYVFVTIPSGVTAEETMDRLQRMARQLEESLKRQLSEKFRHRIHRRIGLFVGFSRIRHSPQVRMERLVYRALREAVAVANTKDGERAALLQEQFRDILSKRQIETHFQPIVDLSTSAIFAYEALSRGPAETPFESPEVLFAYAVRNEQVYSLERICMESSARRYAGRSGATLFVNAETELIRELKTRGHEALEPLLRLGSSVVVEITERAAIEDYGLFREGVSRLHGLGLEIAIDDAGSGYASLQSIAELRPNYIKISNTLVTGLHNDTIKRDVVEMLVKLAARIDAKTVAEGIETEEELHEVKRLGVDYGQGYFLGRPGPL